MPKSPRLSKSKSPRNPFRTPAIRRAVCLEALENRRLLSSDWLLNGTTLTETINGTAQPSSTVSASSTTITAVGADSITIQNYGGSVSVVGGGGGDTLTVYAGSGGSVHFTDVGASSADQVVVRAPATSAANFTASSGSISLSTGDAITYDSSVTTVSLLGQLFSNGDSLTINGSGSQTIAVGANSVSLGGSAPVMFYSTFNGLTVNGGASDNLTVNGDSIPTTLNAGSGSDTFTVTTNSVALSLNGGSGADTYNINSNSGLLIATGGTGDSTFNIAGSSSSMTLNGGSDNNTYTVQSNSATLNINGGGLSNALTVNGNSSTLIARGGTGSTDSYTVNATTGSVSITGGTGSSTYLVSAPTVAAVNITGNVGGTGALTFDGTPLNNAFSITANTVSAGSGATVGFTHMNTLAINGIGGNDSFLVNGDSTATTLNGAAGNSTFNIQSISAGLNINTGTGASTVNLGSNAPLTTNNKVNLLTGAIVVNGDGSDTLNFNDAADTTARTATLTSTTLTGVGTGGLTYGGLATLNLKLGSGGNTIAINSTAAGTITNFNTGSGTNTAYLGSTNSTSLGGVISGIAGALNLNGGTQNALVVDDSGDAIAQTVTLTSTTITGLSPAAISYAGASAMTIDLGTGGNTIGVTSTAAATSVTINGNTGNDAFTIVSDSSPLAINTNGGADTANIQTIAGATTFTSTGGSTITVGNSGVLAGIAALLTVTGSGTDTLTADDSADAVTISGSLGANTIAGLGMTSGIGYTGITSLFLNLGTKANTLAIPGTAAATATHVVGGAGGNSINMTNDAGVTTITGGSGSDSITIQNDSAATSIQSGNGNDTITVQSASAATIITAGNGNDTIAAQNTLASINVTAGNGNDTISLQNSSGVSTILAGDGADVISLQNASAAASITAGNGNDTVTLQSESASTTIQVGNGTDIVNVQAMSVAATVTTGTGADTINVGNNVPATPSSTASITATLTLNGGGNTQLNVDDTGDSVARTVGFTSTAITGISGGSGILYSGMNGLTLSLGSGGNTVTVTNTASTVPSTILTGTGSDTVNVLSTSSATHISVGTGSNTINVGSTGATSGSLMTSISGALTLIGNSSNDTLNLLDAADSLPRVGTLSATQLTGFSPATIAYSHFGSTTLWMGTANNALTISNTSTGSTTIKGGIGNDTVTIEADTGPLTVNTNGGADTLNVQTISGATTLSSGGSSAINVGNAGVLAGIAALLTVNGSGTDTLTVDDSADAATSTGTLSGTAITGLNMSSGINYSGLASLNLNLGTQANTLTISNTAAATATVVTGGASADTITLQNDSGATTITSGNGNDTITVLNDSGLTSIISGNGTDTISVKATTAATSITVGTGTDVVNVSSNSLTTAPIAATLSITGGGATQLNVSDTGDVTARTVALSPTTLTGITGGSGINYSGLSGLNLGLGSGGNTLNISNTAAITNTIDTGTGSDVVNVLNASGTTTIGTNDGNDTVAVTTTTGITNLNTGAGNDTISILATGAQTNVNTGTGTNVVNVGSTGATVGSLLSSINGSLNLTGNSDTLNLLDAADSTGRTGTLTATQLTGFSPATISYSNFGTVNLWTGTVGNTLTIASTSTATTTINAGTAANAITVQNTTGPLTVNAGNSMIGVQNISSATTITATAADHIAVGGQTLAGIHAALTINGVTGSNVLIDDSADATTHTATLGNGILTGLSPGVINYSSLATLAVNLGTASNTLSLNDTTSFTPTTVTGGAGNDTLNILADSAALTLSPAGGNNTVNITNNGLLSGIGSAITLNSTGNDTLNVDDSADTTVRSNAIISGTSISGLGGAAINYTGITTLNVKTGNAADTLAIPSTANGVTTTLHTGAAGNTVNIATTTGPLALTSGGADLVNIGNSGMLSGIAGNASVSGNDTLNLIDTADHANATATLTGTGVSGLGAAGVISYTGLSALNLNLGTGNDTVNVTGTSAGHTTINSGGGSNAITITATTTPLAINSGGTISAGSGSIANLAGHITLAGTGGDQLNLNDTADTTPRTGSLSATQLTLGPANITYTGVGGLTIGLGSGGNTFGIASTSSPVTLNGGSGADSLGINAISAATTINAGSNATSISVGNLLSRLTGPLTIHGSGTNPLTISDAADTAPQTGSLTSGLLNGFNSGILFYDGIGSIDFTLGTGGSGLSMLSHAVPVTVHAGGADAITVYGTDTQPDGFTAPTTIAGNGSTALSLDASAVTSAMSVTLDGSTVNGMGDSAVSYSNLGSLNLLLGSGHDSLNVNGTSAAPTAITSTSAGTAFDLTTTSINGPLQLNGSGSDSLTVDDSANTTGRTITLATGALTGLGGAISYTGMTRLGMNLGSGSDTANITAIDPAVPTQINGGAGTNTASINIAGDFAGALALTHFQTGSLNVGGNFTGSLNDDGSFAAVRIRGNFNSAAVLNVQGEIDQLEVDGKESGQLTVGSLLGVVEPTVTPSSDGTIFSLTQQGVTRSIQIETGSTPVDLPGVTFSVVYDATTGQPQAAIRVNGDTGQQRFDVLLNAPVNAGFSLSRIDSGNDTATDVRNVVVNGDILNSVTQNEANYFGYTRGIGGGVYLPNDALAAVSARDNIYFASVRAKSLQGLAFSTLIGSQGDLHPGGLIPVSDFKEKLLLSILEVNPATKKAYATVLSPTETLMSAAGTAAEKTGLFSGKYKTLAFDPNGVVLYNRDGTGEAIAGLSFATKVIAGELPINLLAWQGTGGSVQTKRIVSNITSTGALGDVFLGAGKAEVLKSITAPSIEGSINLYGGKLTGTIQTTSGDIGQAGQSTNIALQMMPGSRIVSRGDLFSAVQVVGNLLGTISAAGDIDGNLTVSGGGRSTGNVIAFGSISGSIQVAGSFAGELASGSAGGITGNISIARGVAKQGVITSQGQIGDVSAGTSLKTSAMKGTLAAVGPVNLQLPKSKHPPVVAAGNDAGLLASLWMDAGAPLSMDGSTGALGGLTEIESRLRRI